MGIDQRPGGTRGGGVGRPVQAAPVAVVPRRGDEHDVGIRRMHGDAIHVEEIRLLRRRGIGDVGYGAAELRPRGAAIRGNERTETADRVAVVETFAGAGVNALRIRRIADEGGDRDIGHEIVDRRPRRAAVRGLPDAPGDAAHEQQVGIGRMREDRTQAASDIARAQRGPGGLVDACRLRGEARDREALGQRVDQSIGTHHTVVAGLLHGPEARGFAGHVGLRLIHPRRSRARACRAASCRSPTRSGRGCSCSFRTLSPETPRTPARTSSLQVWPTGHPLAVRVGELASGAALDERGASGTASAPTPRTNAMSAASMLRSP